MTNEAAQAGEREALLNQAAGIAMGGWHSVETARAFAAKVSDYILSQGAALPAVQPAESGEPVAYIVRDVEGGSLRDFGDEYSADQYLMQNRARMLKPQVLFCYEKPVAALPQPATTEAGDGVLNKAQVCAALANAGLMLVKTEHGLRVEKAVTGTTAYSVSATPVAAVAQPVADAATCSGCNMPDGLPPCCEDCPQHDWRTGSWRSRWLAVTTEWMIGWNACLDAMDVAHAAPAGETKGR